VIPGIIQINDLTKSYGSHTVVDHLDLEIGKGEIFGLLGPNGAGKSTVILMLLGLTEPDSGSVLVCGINSTSNPVGVKRKVGYLPEDIGFYDDLTAMENLIYTARINGHPYRQASEKASQMLDRVGLSKEKEKKAGKYSRGMRQRLGFADVLVKDPEVIILDEPTLGIDPTGVREFLSLITRLSREDGLTVLFSSHDLHQVQAVCDRVGLFVGGRLLAEGGIGELSQQLLGQSPYTIEAGVTGPPVNGKSPGSGKGKTPDEEWLKKVLSHVDGVRGITRKDERFLIQCSGDLTADIARAIVESGTGLNYLNRKEYGLDEIYIRYFEGNAVEE
jgi:ABC-2 type transport system ATP-binding protein